MPLKKWLCLGKKKDHSDKCLHAKIEIEKYERPLFASGETMIKGTQLVIFCTKRIRIIHKYITSCKHFQTNTLEEFINVK